MKPGHATIETLTNHVLNFETARRADKDRDRMRSLHVRLWGMAVAIGLSHESAGAMQEFFKARIVAHRELRRAARRLAKLALRQAEELRAAHVEHDALCTRIVKLEAEIDRLSGDNWDDRPLPEDTQIAEAFPTRSGRHDLYAEAMRLVGAKRSKGELVKLVTWLLLRAEGPLEGAKARTA